MRAEVGKPKVKPDTKASEGLKTEPRIKNGTKIRIESETDSGTRIKTERRNENENVYETPEILYMTYADNRSIDDTQTDRRSGGPPGEGININKLMFIQREAPGRPAAPADVWHTACGSIILIVDNRRHKLPGLR
ncbi:hypothetical protein EVAR_40407_1 [Eumeta japonica]|uniref:Uncharacterized protein n=1 Tax=Eumeta variegata TaxID=151549 RepID=A0A4C1WAB1_EUMVA|nr:hypothetical protein EVAR_40407_1 [Eumeta japonica]